MSKPIFFGTVILLVLGVMFLVLLVCLVSGVGFSFVDLFFWSYGWGFLCNFGFSVIGWLELVLLLFLV